MQVKKSVYGLKQAAGFWNKKETEVLESPGYKQTCSEPCIYTKQKGNSVINIALYVDDFFIFYNDNVEIENLKRKLQQCFKVKDLGPVKKCLGMEVNRDRVKKTIKLTQTQYLNNVLKRFNIPNGTKPTNSHPIEPNSKLKMLPKSNKLIENLDDVPYQQAVGSVMYLALCMHPDISFAMTYLSQFNTCFTKERWVLLRRVLKYLNTTKDVGIVYSQNNDQLEGFSDADWGGNLDRRSGAAISWRCKKKTKDCSFVNQRSRIYGVTRDRERSHFLEKIMV